MKKIIALALALIMALSMASVAFAAETPTPTDSKAAAVASGTWADAKNFVFGTVAFGAVAPGEAYEVTLSDLTGTKPMKDYRISKVDFTTGDLCGAAYIEDVVITKEKDAFRITVKENTNLYEEGGIAVSGKIYYTVKGEANKTTFAIPVTMTVNNTPAFVTGAKKAANATPLTYAKNTVQIMDEDGGYVTFESADKNLVGTVKMGKDEKAQLYFVDLAKADADSYDALMEVLGEDYDGILEMYTFGNRAFKEEVAFQYDAYEEDPHFFYLWDGEKLTAIDAKYDDDEDVDNYVFSAIADGTILIVDTEIVLAAEEETKNPDTGANDVVGVAAALAVVSLVAAGAVSLKK